MRTPPSGGSGLDRPPSEDADESARERERMLLDRLRDTVRRVDDAVVARCSFFWTGASLSSSASSASPAESASSSRLALLVRYAGRGRGLCSGTTGSWRAGASSPDCSPDSSSVVANFLCLLAALPWCLDGAPPIKASVQRR